MLIRIPANSCDCISDAFIWGVILGSLLVPLIGALSCFLEQWWFTPNVAIHPFETQYASKYHMAACLGMSTAIGIMVKPTTEYHDSGIF